MFDTKKYSNHVSTHWLGQSLLYFPELASTSTHLKNLTSDEVAHGTLCITDHQTKGRGQYERDWESEEGQNLTFTLAFKPTFAERFHVLTLACAKALVNQIADNFGLEAAIKWPNDVMIQDKKMGGLLTETTFSGNKLDRLLVGIGLNINQETFSDALETKATSLKKEFGHEIDREKFLAEYLSRVEHEYTRWHKNDPELLKEINGNIIGHGSWLRLKVNGNVSDEKSKLVGVNEKGQLTVINNEGGIETFSYEQIRLITD